MLQFNGDGQQDLAVMSATSMTEVVIETIFADDSNQLFLSTLHVTSHNLAVALKSDQAVVEVGHFNDDRYDDVLLISPTSSKAALLNPNPNFICTPTLCGPCECSINAVTIGPGLVSRFTWAVKSDRCFFRIDLPPSLLMALANGESLPL